MKILIDTNVLIDYIANRDPFAKAAEDIFFIYLEKACR